MFNSILSDKDAARATSVVDKLLAQGLRGSLTGSLAVEAHLRARGQHSQQRPLNDLDLVVDGFASIPDSVADQFLLHHVHPFAPEGKTLIQLIDPEHALRVDLFRALGETLSRSGPLGVETAPLSVVALEDLVARTTSHVYGCLREGRTIGAKYARTFIELSSFGRELMLEEAWRDHRQDIPGSYREAFCDALRLLTFHPERVIKDEYSALVTSCERCQDYGRFRCAPPERIVEILGYW